MTALEAVESLAGRVSGSLRDTVSDFDQAARIVAERAQTDGVRAAEAIAERARAEAARFYEDRLEAERQEARRRRMTVAIVVVVSLVVSVILLSALARPSQRVQRLVHRVRRTRAWPSQRTTMPSQRTTDASIDDLGGPTVQRDGTVSPAAGRWQKQPVAQTATTTSEVERA